ncbi:phosphomannomutase/phosphoglucomutase [candidate division WOR-3 bacterium]|nr:phosphomannomutase/phosphoglucomutase [candidate division WOR-3 bacterium]
MKLLVCILKPDPEFSYPDELNEIIAKKIGNCFAQIIDGNKILVSRDMRQSSKPLLNALVEGILETGKDVTDIGLASTPMMNFAVGKYDYDAGIQVTASHNPKEYNGFKTVGKGTIPIGFETGLNIVEKKVQMNELKKSDIKGKIIGKNVFSEYKDYVLMFKGEIAPMKVVIDASNGMAGYTLPPILDELSGEFVKLFFEMDGTFPNHESNPMVEQNLNELRKTVLEEKADLGVIFDGDADRCCYVDELGNIIRPDLITGIIAEEVLAGNKEEKILIDVRSSWAVKELIEEIDCIPERVQVGHAYARKKLREDNAILGGELAGHYYFRDNFYCDSGVIAFLYVLRTISRKKKTISELVRPLMRYPGTGEINFKTEKKDKIIDTMQDKYADGEISLLDGLTVEYEDWWFNLRKSNTEPYLRLNIEAKNTDVFEVKKKELIKQIKSML